MNWFEAARERFGDSGEYPLIDDTEIVEDQIVYEYWPWFFGHERSVEELRQAALTADHFDPPVRFVYLNLFYRLAHYPAEQGPGTWEDQGNAAGHREQFEQDLRVLVNFVDVEQCKEARQIRWEIVNSCAIRDWDRARRLYVRLEETAEVEIPQVLAGRARFEFLTVFAGRWELDELGLYWWAPVQDEPQRWRSCKLGFCVSFVTSDSELALSTDELNRLETAVYCLVKAIRARPDLDIVYPLLLLRSRLALGKFHESAADCEDLLKRRDEFPEGISDLLVWELYALAVKSYESVDQVERALGATERWVREFPDDPRIYECRARLYRMQADYRSASEELQKVVDKDPAREKDTAVAIALALGALYQEPEKQWRNFKEQVDSHGEEQVRTVLRVHWPLMEKLAKRNIKDWVDGCYLLLRRKPENPLMVMGAMTRLVEDELRTRVFKPFREAFRLDQSHPSAQEETQDPLLRYLRGDDRITLGQMLNEMCFPAARTESGRRFRLWLDRQGLLTELQGVDLNRLYQLHIPGKHTQENYSPSWQDAEELASLSHRLLSVIIM